MDAKSGEWPIMDSNLTPKSQESRDCPVTGLHISAFGERQPTVLAPLGKPAGIPVAGSRLFRFLDMRGKEPQKTVPPLCYRKRSAPMGRHEESALGSGGFAAGPDALHSAPGSRAASCGRNWGAPVIGTSSGSPAQVRRLNPAKQHVTVPSRFRRNSEIPALLQCALRRSIFPGSLRSQAEVADRRRWSGACVGWAGESSSQCLQRAGGSASPTCARTARTAW
jgi:hypothetical protein